MITCSHTSEELQLQGTNQLVHQLGHKSVEIAEHRDRDESLKDLQCAAGPSPAAPAALLGWQAAYPTREVAARPAPPPSNSRPHHRRHDPATIRTPRSRSP